jgi:hypothetical protein
MLSGMMVVGRMGHDTANIAIRVEYDDADCPAEVEHPCAGLDDAATPPLGLPVQDSDNFPSCEQMGACHTILQKSNLAVCLR